MLQVIGTAAALVGAHRYSNSNAVLVGAVELNAFTGSRYIQGYSKKSEKAKKARKKGDQRISAVADLGKYYCDMYRGRQYTGYARCTQTQLHTA